MPSKNLSSMRWSSNRSSWFKVAQWLVKFSFEFYFWQLTLSFAFSVLVTGNPSRRQLVISAVKLIFSHPIFLSWIWAHKHIFHPRTLNSRELTGWALSQPKRTSYSFNWNKARVAQRNMYPQVGNPLTSFHLDESDYHILGRLVCPKLYLQSFFHFLGFSLSGRSNFSL